MVGLLSKHQIPIHLIPKWRLINYSFVCMLALFASFSFQNSLFFVHVDEAKRANSCYRSCAHGQSLLCLQLRADEAKGSIQWKMTLQPCSCCTTVRKQPTGYLLLPVRVRNIVLLDFSFWLWLSPSNLRLTVTLDQTVLQVCLRC